jgi:hypothetical protein
MRSEACPDKRCSWVNVEDPLFLEYHDRECGRMVWLVMGNPLVDTCSARINAVFGEAPVVAAACCET